MPTLIFGEMGAMGSCPSMAQYMKSCNVIGKGVGKNVTGHMPVKIR